ncbi:MAG: COQ9 family protein [Pseudomonadota bacterium]
MTEQNLKSTLLEAAKPHVPFDGWTEVTFRAAQADAKISAGLAKAACPRGALDLAVAFHEQGDAAMEARLNAEDLNHLRYSEKIATAVRFRIEAIEDRELARRATTLFALPQNAGDGARLIWGTSDRIWTALGDTSQDVNWYTKRSILSGVYGSTLLYWLGDDTPGFEATWAFVDRRINDVMAFEKFKSKIRSNGVMSRMLQGPMSLLDRIRAPGAEAQNFPGRWSR